MIIWSLTNEEGMIFLIKKRKLKIRAINPPSDERKKEIIKELASFIQDSYYS